MKINFPATRERMKLVRIGAWCKVHGLPVGTVTRILSGNYPGQMGPKALRVVEALREDGYLVTEEESSHAA